MRRIAVTIVLPLVLAAALFAPSSALAGVGISGSGHGTETKAGTDAYTVSGTWSSGNLFGAYGKYVGSFTLGDHVDCAMPVYPQCPAIRDTNCYLVEDVTLYFEGSYPLSPGSGFSIKVHEFPPIQQGAEENSICRPPLPGNPRYINLPWLGDYWEDAPFSYGLGNLTGAYGALFGSSTVPTWLQQAGGNGLAWIDTFTFNITAG